SSVELEPVPAMTGTRPRATEMQSSVTRRCSSWLNVGDSPVVPQGTTPWVPSVICQSTKASNAFSSTFPLRNGVISAQIEPLNMVDPPGSDDSPASAGGQGARAAETQGNLEAVDGDP